MVNLASVDANLIVALHALLCERSVTRAARRLGLSQPAMSHSLGKLRTLLDDPLLVRAGREMTLTERARGLITDVADTMEGLTRIFSARPSFAPETAKRVFQLAATDYAQLVLLPALDRLLHHEAPGISVRVRPLSRRSMVESLRNREIDLAISILPEPQMTPWPEDVHSAALFDECFVGIARKGHPALRRKLDLARYCELSHVQISPGNAPGSAVDQRLAERGLRRHIAFTVPSFLVVPHIVANSDHVALISRRVASPFARILPLQTFEPPILPDPIAVGAIWHRRTDNDPAHAWLRQAVQKSLASGTGSQ